MINEAHALERSGRSALAKRFQKAIGRRILALVDSVPFLIIGSISNVVGTFVLINVEVSHVQELEGRLLRLQLQHIKAFYIEEDGRPIPSIG